MVGLRDTSNYKLTVKLISFFVEWIMEFLFAGLVSAFVACVIFATKSYHLMYSAKGHSGAARQSAHHTPTPRIGGIAIFSGFIAGTAMLPSDVAAYAVPLLLSCIAVFFGGLGEDIGRDVGPKTRLILSFISALCAIAIFRVWIGPLGSPYLNWITSTLLGGDRIHCADLGSVGACDKSD